MKIDDINNDKDIDKEIKENNIFEIVKDKFELILEIKLSDFGASKLSKNTIANTSIGGTLCYMAPELIK